MIGTVLGDAFSEAFGFLLRSGLIVVAYLAFKRWAASSLKRRVPAWLLIAQALGATLVASAVIAYAPDHEFEDLADDQYVGARARAKADEAGSAADIPAIAFAELDQERRLRLFLRTNLVLLVAFAFALSDARPCRSRFEPDEAGSTQYGARLR